MIKTETAGLSVGIIMDGNRRWAKRKNLPTFEGHQKGAEKLKELVRWAEGVNVTHIIAYAFSTENWKRGEEEVGALMKLLEEYLKEDLRELSEHAQVRFIGEREKFSANIQRAMEEVEKQSQATGPVLAIALSYGGRSEIVRAAQRLQTAGTPITEESINGSLMTTGIPDPDLIIRTGGEQRLSNFLPWQSVYSELVFTDTLWPDFSEQEFVQHLQTFRNRKRNFGV